MVPIGAWSPIEAVTIGHEEGTVTARLSTPLGSIAVPAGTGPIKPQCSRWKRIAIIQDGRFSFSISVSLDASEKTFKLLSLLSGWGRRADRLLLVLRMDR